MATHHFILQGKGGVGKSLISAILFQALAAQGKSVSGFDVDAHNPTFYGFKEFNVTRFEVVKNGEIDPRQFDKLLGAINSMPEGSHSVTDSGASSFVAFSSYIEEIGLFQVLQENGHTVYLHTIVAGGQNIHDTLFGLKSLAVGFEDTPIVVWLNPYFGEISLEGKSFEDFIIYEEHGAQFHAIIKMPEGKKATLGRDLEELLANRRSFAAEYKNPNQHIAVRSRLNRHWQNWLAVIEMAGLG